MATSQSTALSVTWNLDTTVGKTINLSTEVIRACTSDHVQPLAILVCETFGTQLAMSVETIMKMEQAAQRKSISKAFKQIEVMIGFHYGDTADFLAKSDGGTRFLGLATAILTAGTHFQAASILYSVLKHFTSSDQLMPTIQQLKELLQAIEPKLACTGFAQSLATWSKYLSLLPEEPAGSRINRKALDKEEHGLNPRSGECPPAQEIARIIQAISEIHRIGQAGFALFQIPLTHAAWVIALVQWCTGSPPIIRSELPTSKDLKGLMQSLELQTSKIMVRIVAPDQKIVKFQVFKAMDSLEDILWEHSSQSISKASLWRGLVSPQLYMEHRVEEIESDFKVKHVSRYMLILATDFVPDIGVVGEPIARNMMRPFPRRKDLVRLFKRLLSVSPEDFEKTDDSVIISYWRKASSAARTEAAKLLLDLLTISIVDNIWDPDSVFYVGTKQRDSPVNHKLLQATIDFISRGTSQRPYINPWSIYMSALYWIHGDEIKHVGYSPLLIAARGGQAVYTSLLDSMEFSDFGPFRLQVSSGHLLYEGLRFAYAEGQQITVLGDCLSLGKARTSDYRQIAGQTKRVEKSAGTWFCNLDDGFLSIYYKLDIGWSIYPQRFFDSLKFLIPVSPCYEECLHDLGELASQVSFCSEIAVALSSECPTTICVLENVSNRGREYQMFVYAVLAEYRWNLPQTQTESLNETIDGKTFVISQGSSCLARACEKALQVIQDSPNSSQIGPKRAIIIQ